MTYSAVRVGVIEVWGFLKILLFSAVISITGGKRDFSPGRYQLDFHKPLVAINGGASMYVDVSSMSPVGSLALRREWADHFPLNSITVLLFSSKSSGEPVRLTYQGGISYTGNSLFLILSSDKDVPQNLEYVSAEFTTAVNLTSVELFWKNYGK